MRTITVEVDPADVYFSDIAEQVADGAGESDLLEALANANDWIARQTGDEKERQWCLSCAAILREAAAKLKVLP